MAYKKVSKKFAGKINEVTIGTGDKAMTIGGRNVLPLYSFDGEAGHSPKLGLELTDIASPDWAEGLKSLYGDVYGDPVAWAKLIEEKYAPDFICLRFEGADPSGEDKSIAECVEVAKKVADAITLPLAIAGCKNTEKDSELFKSVSEALEGKNILIYSADEDNYKTVGASAGIAYKHKVAGESAVDINLAKQLNILFTQLGVKEEDLVMDIGGAAVGYGFEYVISTADRIMLAALGQNDTTITMPIVAPIATEAWTVKESMASEEDEPTWGNVEERGIHMEISTASSSIAFGADGVIMRHPKSLETMKEYVNGIIG